MKTHFKSLALLTLTAALVVPAVHAVPDPPGPAPKEAFLVPVKDNWEINPAKPGAPADLAENLMLIGLQGLAKSPSRKAHISSDPNQRQFTEREFRFKS